MSYTNSVDKVSNYTLKDLELIYTKSFAEEMEEKQMVLTAELWLEGRGIKVKTDMYGYYRSTWDILKDLGEYLSKNNRCVGCV
jgi:hypothetical protein